jgi:hypothetical protein
MRVGTVTTSHSRLFCRQQPAQRPTIILDNIPVAKGGWRSATNRLSSH